MIFDESSKDKLKDSLKFNFPFRAEKIEMTESNIIIRPPSNPTTPITTSIPKHDFSDPDVFYVCRDFFATVPEHLSVFVDDELEIIEELPGGNWTRVRERESNNNGLIPTEILESGPERLAKQNKSSNQDTIRVMSCGNDCNSSSNGKQGKSKNRKSVSFSETEPVVLSYPADPEEHFSFPFTLDEETSQAIVPTEAIFEQGEITEDQGITDKTKQGFLSKLFRTGNKKNVQSKSIETLGETLKSFELYTDHLIRVYTGNFDSVLHSYKTFIVDETLTFSEFSQLVLGTFQLDCDGFAYEVNLINHLTAEIIPIDLDFTIEQVIELTKREGLPFNSRMPSELKKVQKGALKKLHKQQKSHTINLNQRDKSTDYVTPFKFVLNRIYGNNESVPIYVHLSLAYNPDEENSSDLHGRNLILSSLFDNRDESLTKEKKKKKWYNCFSKNESQNALKESHQTIHRIPSSTQTPLHVVIHSLLESLQVPSTLPGIVFEAFLPAIHDAVELPLPMSMPVGDVLKIRPKLDPSEQVLIIRPVILQN